MKKMCKKEYDDKTKKCFDCKVKLQAVYTDEELREIQKQNDDFTVINTMLV